MVDTTLMWTTHLVPWLHSGRKSTQSLHSRRKSTQSLHSGRKSSQSLHSGRKSSQSLHDALDKEDETHDSTQEEPSKNGESTSDELYLTVDEAVEHMVNELGMPEERVVNIIKKINKNKDGKVSNQELIDLWTRISKEKNKVKRKFEVYDKDGNGTVSTDEALEALKSFLPGVSEDGLKKMIDRYEEEDQMHYNDFIFFYAYVCAKKKLLMTKFQELDLDNSGELDFSQLSALIIEECACDEKEAQSLVEDFDLNNDGTINKTEFIELWDKMFPETTLE